MFDSILLATTTSDKVWPIVILAVYMLAMVGIAIYSRRRTKSLDDFVLAGRGMGGWMSAFAYGTTYFSSVIFIGYAGKFGWEIGISSIMIGIGNALIGSLLAWQVLAKRTRMMTHRLGARTMPEFFEKRYEDKGLKLFSAIIIFVFLVPYSASVYQGLGYLFEVIFGIDFIWCIIIMAIITALYLVFGGYFATALSDFVQGIVMLVGVIVMVIMIIKNPIVGGSEGLDKLTELGLGFIPNAEGGWDSPLFNLIILVLLTSFGMWGLPQSVHKFYAIRDDKAISQAMIISTVFCFIIGTGAYLTGAFGILYLDGKLPAGGYDAIVPEMLKMALPAAMLGLIMVLVLSASMSTLASLSLSGASSLGVDAYKGFIKPDASEKKVNRVVKVLCLIFVLISVILAITKVQAIVTLMSLSWGTLAGCFIGPYVLGLYSKKVTKAGCYASLGGSLILTLLLIIIFGCISPKGGELTFGNMISGGVARAPLIGVICMAFSFIITAVVSKFTHKPSDSMLGVAFDGDVIMKAEDATIKIENYGKLPENIEDEEND